MQPFPFRYICIQGVDPDGFGVSASAPHRNSKPSYTTRNSSFTSSSSHGTAADATTTDPALLEHAWLQLAPFVREHCNAQVCLSTFVCALFLTSKLPCCERGDN